MIALVLYIIAAIVAALGALGIVTADAKTICIALAFYFAGVVVASIAGVTGRRIP